MPYIKEEQRIKLLGSRPRDAGELNYCFTIFAKNFVADNGLSYATINSVIGALEAAKLEFYRRVVVPYEQTKIEINGDVYK